jgi:hypothetical protein
MAKLHASAATLPLDDRAGKLDHLIAMGFVCSTPWQ